LTVSSLAAGIHTINVAYNGATQFAMSSGTVSQTVIKAATSTSLTSSLNPAIYGQAITLTSTVSSAPATPSGSVTFADGATPLGSATLNASGQAVLAVSLAAGPHSLSASYGGSANFATSGSSALAESIGKATTTTVLTSSPNPSTSSQAVNFVASVAGQYGGSVTGTVSFRQG